jgi:hypothetical protein
VQLGAVNDDPRSVDDRVWNAVQRLLGAGGADGPSGVPREEDVGGHGHHADRERAHCRSCLADLRLEENRGRSECYCRYCSDENGRLRPRSEVHEILAAWLSDLQGGLSDDEAARRAAYYMLAMPAWAAAEV